MNDTDEGSRKSDSVLSLTRSAWHHLPRALHSGWGVLVVLGVVSALLESGLAWVLWQALNGAGSGSLVAVTVLIFLRVAVRMAELLGGETLAERTTTHLNQLLLDRFFRGGWLKHQQTGSQELWQRIHDDSEQIARKGFLGMARALSEALTMLVLIAALVVVTGTLVLALAAALLVLASLVVWLVHARYDAWSGRNHQNWLQHRRHSMQMFAGTRELLISGRVDDFLEQHLTLRSECERLRREGVMLSSGPALALESFFLLLVLMLLLIAPTAGATALFAVYAGLRLLPSMLRGVQHFNAWLGVHASLQAVHQDLQAPVVIESVPQSTRGGNVEAVEVDNAGVHYGDTEIFSHARMHWSAGQWIAVCGPTGSGKTTLLHLVAGMLEPTTGNVRVDGIPLEEARAAWWTTMGLVPQEPFVFEDTLYANLVLRPGARMDSAQSDQAARQALQTAGLGDWPDAFEHGWNTILGESGARLSGGQRQRLAFARVLLARPSWLILDEPTAALDQATEAELIARLKALDPPISVLVASHRDAWLDASDAVCSLQDRKLVARLHQT